MMILTLLIVVCLLIYLHYFPGIPKRNKVFEYGLLLGCPNHNDGSLCTSQKKRCKLAIDDYNKGYYNQLIITGGAVKNQYIESEEMKKYILSIQEIPILCETKSRNTFENFTFSKEIIQEHSVLILTSGTHARRACAIARQFFSDYSADWYKDHKPRHILREIISRFIYIKIEIKKQFSGQ